MKDVLFPMATLALMLCFLITYHVVGLKNQVKDLQARVEQLEKNR